MHGNYFWIQQSRWARAHVTQATKCQIEIHHHFVLYVIQSALGYCEKTMHNRFMPFSWHIFLESVSDNSRTRARRDTQSWAGNISKLLLSIIFFTLRDKQSNPIHEAAIHQRNGAFVSNRQQESYERTVICGFDREPRRARMRIAYTCSRDVWDTWTRVSWSRSERGVKVQRARWEN
jgi:hypothetical protein